MALKLIFMGTPEFALPIMKALNYSSHDIAAVYTQAPKKAKGAKRLIFHQFTNILKNLI